MHLYLIRHAEAEPLETAGITRDFDRPLTSQGRADSRALARAFAKQHIVVDVVAASPLVRAHQTAVEFLSVLAPSLPVVTCDELAIDRLKPGKLSDLLADLPVAGERVPSRDEKAVVAIGHMPDIGAYCEWLLGAAEGSIRFAKTAAACLRFKDDPARAAGTLEWLITPDWL